MRLGIGLLMIVAFAWNAAAVRAEVITSADASLRIRYGAEKLETALNESGIAATGSTVSAVERTS